MVPTVTRRPRMQGLPPITPGSCVILSRTSMVTVYRHAGSSATVASPAGSGPPQFDEATGRPLRITYRCSPAGATGSEATDGGRLVQHQVSQHLTVLAETQTWNELKRP